jgi:hypothetical protein
MALEKSFLRVRFRTEKPVGFPSLTANFVRVAAQDSSGARNCGGGALVRIIVGLAKC